MKINRRTLLSGLGGTAIGAIAVGSTRNNENCENYIGEWPYWTQYWSLTRFEANPDGNCDLQVLIGLKNDSEYKRTWTGVIQYFNQTQFYENAYAPALEAEPGEKVSAGPWIKARPGKYEIQIKGTDHTISNVVVQDAERGCGNV